MKFDFYVQKDYYIVNVYLVVMKRIFKIDILI